MNYNKFQFNSGAVVFRGAKVNFVSEIFEEAGWTWFTVHKEFPESAFSLNYKTKKAAEQEKQAFLEWLDMNEPEVGE
jgi:hypothetical protein